MIINTIFFLLGWLANHWYSVNMRRPSLRKSGTGGGSNLSGTGYHFVNISITNELRRLTLSLPETTILGKRIPTSFGNQVIERDPARQCKARLLEKSGKHICYLWWQNGNTVTDEIEIKSGESVNLILFVRRDNEKKYFVYNPISSSDVNPKTSGIPTFNKTKTFRVLITYTHGSQNIEFPVKVILNYDGSLYFETEGSSAAF